ncbi:MAG: MarR family transcriptional regulator [Dehalococcoidia bacterium]|jgi:DNA-binding MarR family transcriptional regulator
MKNNSIEQVTDLLFRLPRIMKGSLEREVFKPPLHSIDSRLSPHHMMIMKIVDEEGMLNISEIGDTAMISKAQMTQSIDKLTSLGMLERQADPTDRRKTWIVLTDKGREAVEFLDKAIKERMTGLLSALDDKELERTLESLKYLIATFERFI